MAQRKLTAPTKKPIRLAPVRPNAGLTIRFQAQIDAMIDAMNRDTLRVIRRTWKARPPEMATDISPAAALRNAMSKLATKWTRRFADFAETIGGTFGRKAAAMTDRAMAAALKKAGFMVKFSLTREINDIVQANVADNVTLIKSIPAEYLTDVQGSVMRSVQTGRDLGTLTAELDRDYGISRRRAALIAKTQNQMATATITRARQLELNITQAIWRHSAAGRVPRPTHVANNGKLYNIAEGWLDPAVNKRIWPGMEINCRCISIPVITGIS